MSLGSWHPRERPSRVGEQSMSLDEALGPLAGSRTHIRFRELLAICVQFFGEPRIRGSHHIFKMPWPGDPRMNLQEDGSHAKPYQVHQVLRALHKLKEQGSNPC